MRVCRSRLPVPWGTVALSWSGSPANPRIHSLSLDQDGDATAEPIRPAPPPLRALIADLVAGRDRGDALAWCEWGQCAPFARDVLQALAREVPCGGTTSYGELARLVGRPGAARAVGRVMAANPFPLLVPCHRCLAAGGRIGGFQGGRANTGLKQAMLLHEQGVTGR